ncbi:hypothetical protein FND36_10325 [Lachnospiraceae bacterium KGMB03038]|nr:hypothetical protein FND36_10325 [Lachnospiraceae bacterium KGMB03038]
MRKPRNEPRLIICLRTFLLSHSLIPYKTSQGKILSYDAVRVLISCVYDVDDSTYNGKPIQTHFLDAYLGGNYPFRVLNHAEIFSALEYLRDAGLIMDLRGTPDRYTFYVTHEGIHYFELRRKNFVYLFFTSVFLPIIVSAATTIITIFIAG